MADKGALSSYLELMVGIDKSSFDKSRTRLKQLNDAVDLKIDPKTLKEISEGLRGAISAADRSANDVLSKRTDRVFEALITDYAKARDEFIDAHAGDKKAQEEYFALQDSALSALMDTEMKAHKLRLEAAEKLKEATTPNVKKFKEASEELGKGFMDAIGKAKSGDLSGLAESFGGAISGQMSKKAGALDLAAQSAGSAEEAAALGAAASQMAIAASAVAMVAGAIAAVIALFVAADAQAKEFNTTLLDGAGVADFTFKKMGSVGGQLEDTLVAAQEAAFDMAYEWRGQAKDYVEMVAALNKAGLTYKEMIQGAETFEEKKEALGGYMEATLKWSKVFGLSTAEMAEDIARLTEEQGASLESITEQFASVSGWAQMSGMGTKRFFTAVSQATAGMALYNNRMEEAAGLLMLTSEALGGADASEFIKSLSKGFVDESYQDRYKRMLLTGVKDTKAGFIASLGPAVEEFGKSLQTSDSVKRAFTNVLGASAADISIADPAVLQKTLGGMSQEQTDQLRLELQKASRAGDSSAQGALQQLRLIGQAQAASTGNEAAMVKGMGALTMQAKLASKLDNFMGKRLNEMGITDIMAYEQSTGISGEQLEQMMAVEDMLYLNYKTSLNGAEESHSGFIQWVASNDEAKKISEEMKDSIQTSDELAMVYASKTMDNTHSIFDVLKNEISRTLLLFYKFAIKGDPKEARMQALAEETAVAQEQTREAQETNKEDLKKAKMELAVAKAQGADAGVIKEKDDAVRSLGRVFAELEMRSQKLAQNQKDIRAGKEITETTAQIDKSGAQAWAAVNNVDASKAKEAFEAVSRAEAIAAAKVTRAHTRTGRGGGVVKGDEAVIAKEMADAKAKAREDALAPYLEDTVALTDEQRAEAEATAGTLDKTLKLDKKEVAARKKWETKGYPEETLKAMFEAMQKSDAMKLAGEMGIAPGKDFDAAVADILDKGAITSDALKKGLAAKPDLSGRLAGFGGDLPPGANDFVMRPGQKAQRFSSADTLIGMKEGGPLASMGGGGGSQHITINVNGGDPAQVYQTVKSAMKNSGARTG